MEPIIFCRGGGCTAKLGPGALRRILDKIPRTEDPHLLVGYDSSDDAAVYQLTEDLAMVQTLDFFPPMVEDPYLFGQIAAANALSDVYAMGGEVRTAMNLVCFPEEMDLNVLGRILQGGAEKVREAGGVLAGGHSIADAEVKYGLSVTGIVRPSEMWRNTGCREGDILLLTKPLGVGIVCTAARMKAASSSAMDQALRSMTALNKYAANLLKKFHVHACTDVTGFGFLVHLSEMLGDSFGAEIWADQIPYIAECEDYVEEFYLTAAAQRNRNHMEGKVAFHGCSFAQEELLFDPQTSGGLLVSLSSQDADRAMEAFGESGMLCAAVGRIVKRDGIAVTVINRGGRDDEN